MSAKIYLLCGMPGAGKTYFAKEFAEKNGYKYVSIDERYKAHNGSESNRENKFKIWLEFYELIHYYEVVNCDIVVDTNAPTLFDRSEFLNWFPTFEHHLIWIDAPIDLCLKNNRNRKRVIPEDTMKKLFLNFEEPTMFTYTISCRARSQWKSISMIKNNNNHFENRLTLFGSFPKGVKI